MVNTATGSSPPWSSTREMACSPIRFDVSVQTSTSDDSNCGSSRMNHKKKQHAGCCSDERVCTNELFFLDTQKLEKVSK